MMMVFPFHFWYSTINNLMTTCFRITLTCFVAISTYGFLRWVHTICPITFEKFSIFMQVMGSLSFVFAACCIIYQKNLIKKINYISIASSSFILISIFTNQDDLSAIYMVLLSYCFEIIMLIEFTSIIKNRFKTLNMKALSGIKFSIPNLNMFFIPLMFTIINIPLSIGFIGKFLTIKNLIKNNMIVLAFIVIGIILIVMSIIEIYRKVFLGKPIKEGVTHKLKINEIIVFVVSLSIIYFIGIFPFILIEKMG
ncbi:MAG: NAD(P)H-quinone oxidoreductase chain 4 1 [Alphaproteobacteria bacterium ADurb.Bin438]|nr:MAG: NAD(P)H-quinone oxidoreductase chain 4 1 [Alphaproteobacteria bacterium ADurb.Bin438]